MSRNVLAEILEATAASVAQLRRDRAAWRRAALEAPPPVDWAQAMPAGAVGVIAEVKRRSPSAGPIAEQLAPELHARAYVAGGAWAVSVLTEERHFRGSFADLEAVRRAVPVPVLCKDFIVDETQLYRARAAGASAVLLIARILDSVRLAELAALARELQLVRLVEVHSAAELDRALAVAPEAVGVNARDLETFRLDVAAIEPVLRAVPPEVTAVAESGLSARAQVEQVADWGADAVLVGSAVARAPDPAAAVRALVGVPRRAGVRGQR